jgi:hypothetical protein
MIKILSCISSDYIILERYFSEEKISGLVIKKNDVIIEYILVTLSVGSHLLTPYGFWKHTNNATGKESVFLNTENNNFLEGTIIIHVCQCQLKVYCLYQHIHPYKRCYYNNKIK